MSSVWDMPPPARLPRRLRPYVSAMYGYGATDLTPGVHHGLPGRTLTVVFALEQPLCTAVDHAAWRRGDVRSEWTVLGGLHTVAALIEQPTRWAGIQLAVHPLGARRLFGLPAAALPTEHHDAREVLGPDDDAVHTRLEQAGSWAQRYAVVVDFLLGRLQASADSRRVRPDVVHAWRWLEQRGGSGSIEDLSREVGLGRRRLAQVFADEVGVTPKVASRLIRFDAAQRALGDRVRSRAPLDLAGIAHTHGYADHSHLVREFTAFTGLSPSSWVRAEVANIQAATGGRGAHSSHD